MYLPLCLTVHVPHRTSLYCSEKEIFTSILRGNLDFTTAPWPSISDPAKGA